MRPNWPNYLRKKAKVFIFGNMIETDGKFLNETLSSLGLAGDDKTKAIANAQNIVQKIVTSYEESVGRGHVGKNGNGVPSGFSKSSAGSIGLVYGRIQSGKTRAMITSTAMAFDNGFRIAVVLTSNINDLVTQTHMDFSKDLRGVSVITKDDELDIQISDAKLDMENPKGRILVVASKGIKSLKNVTDFLKKIGGDVHPMVIFDDEGDQASLDTNTYKRSSSSDLTLQPSSINRLIGKLRKDFPASVYISVTGTPQAVLLQSATSDVRPSFINMLPHGSGYVGGDYFFNTEEPEDNPHHLISIVPAADKDDLLNPKKPVPVGLRSSLIFFLLSASAATRILGENNKGYQFLCHPSLKNNEQDQAKNRISIFLTEVKRVLSGYTDTLGINKDLEQQYNELKKQLGSITPQLEDLKEIIGQELLRKKILVINAQNSKRRGIEYGPGFNFLIGGNTLGRGIAIPNLLATYYVRSTKTSQIDTMHQHARMFGYRMSTLQYTRLFIPKNLYYRFRDIHYSDKGLRGFIERHIDAPSFPVEFSEGLQPTRKSVLDVNTTDAIWPGMQIYPNYMKLPQSHKSYHAIMELVADKLRVGNWEKNLSELERKGKVGVIISVDEAIEIISQVKTKSKNSWDDKTIGTVVKKIAQRLGGNVKLKFRTAERSIGEGGFLAQGTISGAEQNEGRADSIPTLWIMSVTGKADSDTGASEIFAFPTVIVPTGLPRLFLFSKQ